jgi:exodeoxyribonuclease VII small subunit
MNKKQSGTANYAELRQELSDITAKLEGGELGVDEAVGCYKRGLAIIKQLEEQLERAELTVRELREQFGAPGDARSTRKSGQA